ncbi:DUF1565 domain-containing protein [Hahella ganghwensis]|uniref:DUF1565 domain-containing protein n=1 Tax=Hahella ganghwensis TaxID=286420 RepID=UPI00036AEC55|nr:right-handed parallel beta-helix repeat-containing protein [Hahella ganghwensis]
MNKLWTVLLFVSVFTQTVWAMPVQNSYEEFDYPNFTTFYVSPTGDDNNSGSEQAPLQSINMALSLAQAGDRVYLQPGHYYENVRSVRHGQADMPIIIHGSKSAVLHGAQGRILEINHSYIHLRNFTIDGQVGSGNTMEDFRDILVYVKGNEPQQGPTGFVMRAMSLKNAGGECVRLRYYVTEAEIFDNTFYNCGVYDFKFNNGGKNGEAIYVGTSSNQWDDGKNPTGGPDPSNHNWIHHNKFLTNGNECVDIKEGAEYNLVEYNICSGQQDPNSAGFDSRGDHNIFRYNVSHDNKGAGVRLGGNTVDGRQYGVNNQVYGNLLYNNAQAGVKLMAAPQEKVCGNPTSDNTEGDIMGSSAMSYDPELSC